MFKQGSVRKVVTIAVALAAVLVVTALPAAAQDASPSYPVNTITVTGIGDALGAPDAASIDVGVDVFNVSVQEAFTQANDTARAIVEAVSAVGIPVEDIRTSYLSVYTDFNYADSGEQRGFRASNTVNILVSDVSKVEAVIDAAIGAGATNINGLNFIVTDTSALEQEARVDAMANARARAEQLAEIAGATLGDVIIISEVPGGYNPLPYAASFDTAEGRGGAFVTPGQSTVSVQLQVTFAIVR